MSRTFNTPHREDWNPKIHNILKTIDLHTDLYNKTGDVFHQEQAEYLRCYVYRLKDWIKKEESEKLLLE
jgi:hypothetical protein